MIRMCIQYRDTITHNVHAKLPARKGCKWCGPLSLISPLFQCFFTLHLLLQSFVLSHSQTDRCPWGWRNPLLKKKLPTPHPPSQCLAPFILLIVFLSSLHLIHPHTFFSPYPPMHAKWTREPRSDLVFSQPYLCSLLFPSPSLVSSVIWSNTLQAGSVKSKKYQSCCCGCFLVFIV